MKEVKEERVVVVRRREDEGVGKIRRAEGEDVKRRGAGVEHQTVMIFLYLFDH